MSNNWGGFYIRFKRYLQLERSLSKNSIEAYTDDLKKLQNYSELFLGGQTPDKFSFKQLQNFIEWIATLGFSASTQGRVVSGIKTFYKFLLLENDIKQNPADLLETPKIPRKLPVFLTIEEIDKMLGGIDRSTQEGERNYSMLETLYSCGLRVSELTGLRITDLHLNENYIKVVGKGNKERLVPIGQSAAKYINLYRQTQRQHLQVAAGHEDILFLNRHGRKLSRVMIFLIIRELVQQAGIKKNVSPHTFRHSFATHLVEGGADLRAVQEMLGHESITTTEIYTHLDREFLRTTLENYHPAIKGD